MALFAKKIRYVGSGNDEGCSGGFVALIKLSNKKGGEAVRFILYRYSGDKDKADMIEVSFQNEAEKMFPYGKIGLWKPTSMWLFKVAVGGAYAVFGDNVWVKVGKPHPRPKKKKKTRLVFGELSHLYRIWNGAKKSFEEKIGSLEFELNVLTDREGFATHGPGLELMEKIKELKEEARIPEEKANCIYQEMQFVYSRGKECGEE